jgi:hypothetical protein
MEVVLMNHRNRQRLHQHMVDACAWKLMSGASSHRPQISSIVPGHCLARGDMLLSCVGRCHCFFLSRKDVIIMSGYYLMRSDGRRLSCPLRLQSSLTGSRGPLYFFNHKTKDFISYCFIVVLWQMIIFVYRLLLCIFN